jgi:DNA-binding transcriptional ArsR family regulator
VNPPAAIAALSALAHEHRLAVFRLLMRAGPAGLAAGEIAERTGLVRSTLSFHLALLERAGLLSATRRQRNIFYAVNAEGTRNLIDFLTRDCCGGRPEICGLDAAAPKKGKAA